MQKRFVAKLDVLKADGSAETRVHVESGETLSEAASCMRRWSFALKQGERLLRDPEIVELGGNITGLLYAVYENDPRRDARRVWNALDREDYWVTVYDGKWWYLESNTASRGCSASQYKFLDRELRRMLGLEPSLSCWEGISLPMRNQATRKS